MFKRMIMTCKAVAAVMLFSLSLSAFSMCDRCNLCGTYPETNLCQMCSEYVNCLHMCPLIIDLDNDGFSFGGSDSIVEFDMFMTGIAQSTQWVATDSDDAFLVMDLNKNGIVDDGAEMFGNGTLILANGTRAENGFAGLAQYDLRENGGNGDGRITKADQVWSSLSLWLDYDANGISEPHEVASIEGFEIEGFGITSVEKKQYDAYGNWLRYFGHVDFKNEANGTANGRLLDVFFLRSPVSRAKIQKHNHAKMED